MKFTKADLDLFEDWFHSIASNSGAEHRDYKLLAKVYRLNNKEVSCRLQDCIDNSKHREN